MAVTLKDAVSSNDAQNELALNMDNATDQAQLASLMAQGRVRAIHSQEATLEEVFIEVAGVRPA